MSIADKAKLLTNKHRKFMLAKSPMYTPVNPKEQGWSGDKVLEWQWTPLNVLYDYIDAVETNAITYTNELIAQINTNQTDIASLEENKVNKAGDTRLTGEFIIKNGSLSIKNTGETRGTIVDYQKVEVSNLTDANIYCKMIISGFIVSSSESSLTTYLNGSVIVTDNGSNYQLTFPKVTDTLAYNGQIVALNTQLTNVNDYFLNQINTLNQQHISSIELTNVEYDTSFIKYNIKAKNVNNGVRSEFTINIPEATTSQAGLLNSTDKGKINAIANDIATALSSANNYTDSKVARSNLVNVLGEATTALNGLMSAEDKSRLDVLYALLGEGGDDDTIVDTIREVLKIFENYPEGADLVNALSLKINYTDIVDNLTSSDTNKPLSANQGRVLKGQIDNIVNGTTIVGKANMDSEGNVIKDTYFNREDGFAVGLVSVTEYDEDTGEVTLEYNSSAVTNIAYDTNTGVITFTY